MKKQTENINQLSPFDVRWVNQLRSFDDVTDTHGFVITNASVKFPNGKDAPVMIIGSDYPALAAGPYSELVHAGTIQSLAAPEIVSTDFYDNKTLGYNIELGTRFEINGKTAIVGVITKDAKGFTSPLIYTTADKARYYSGMLSSQVSGIIVTVPDHSKIEAVVSQINNNAPDLKAWPADQINEYYCKCYDCKQHGNEFCHSGSIWNNKWVFYHWPHYVFCNIRSYKGLRNDESNWCIQRLHYSVSINTINYLCSCWLFCIPYFTCCIKDRNGKRRTNNQSLPCTFRFSFLQLLLFL